jgi:hypothetical protein
VLFETLRVEGRAGKRFFGPEKRQLAGFRQQKTLPLSKRGSPVHALIEFVRRFRVGKRIARKALLIEKDGPGVLFLSQRGLACRIPVTVYLTHARASSKQTETARFARMVARGHSHHVTRVETVGKKLSSAMKTTRGIAD